MKGRTYPRRGLHGALVHDIGVRILRGELKPGDLLPTEDERRDELTVSRTVLREAIKVLAAKGLVESRPKTGTRVRPRGAWNLLDPDVLAWRLEMGPDRGFLKDIIDLRRIIEPEAARLAAERATDDEIIELEAALAQMRATLNDPEAHLGPDLRFHELILEACHNELVEQMASTLRAIYKALLVRSISPPTSAKAMPLHAAIVQAIRDRDGDRAEVATRVLIDDTAAIIDRTLPRED